MGLFFLTGLPRVRSAWLSVLLSDGDNSLCLHDALKNNTPKSLVHYLRESDRKHAGDADSSLLLHVEEVVRLCPDAAWVLVHRDPIDSLDSYWKHFGTRYPGAPQTYEGVVECFGIANKLFKRARLILPKALHVNFSDLDDVNTVRKVWAHCIPGVEFPFERWAQLDGMRVNVIPEKVKVGVK